MIKLRLSINHVRKKHLSLADWLEPKDLGVTETEWKRMGDGKKKEKVEDWAMNNFELEIEEVER